MNTRILEIIKRKKNILIIFIVFGVLLTIMVKGVFKFFHNSTPDLPYFFDYAFLSIMIIGFTIGILIQLLRIKKIKELKDVKPIKCVIKEFVYIGYRENNSNGPDRIKYEIYPIVLNLEDNQLYFTYGDYCLAGYNKITSQNGNRIVDIKIFRKDKSTVQVGDIAYLYNRKEVNVKVKIDEKENIVYLNNKKIKTQNQIYDPHEFENINYFEGIIDIENNY